MTWLKLPDEFPKECRRAKLSDAAFRLHVEGLCAVMDDENDGYVDADDVQAFTRAQRPFDAVKELERVGFWQRLGSGQWRIVHMMEHQPDAETLTRRRQMDAERQNKHRRKKAGLAPEVSRRDETCDAPGDETRDPVRVGSGRDGSGQALEEGGSQEVIDTDGNGWTVMANGSLPSQGGAWSR